MVAHDLESQSQSFVQLGSERDNARHSCAMPSICWLRCSRQPFSSACGLPSERKDSAWHEFLKWHCWPWASMHTTMWGQCGKLEYKTLHEASYAVILSVLVDTEPRTSFSPFSCEISATLAQTFSKPSHTSNLN